MRGMQRQVTRVTNSYIALPLLLPRDFTCGCDLKFHSLESGFDLVGHSQMHKCISTSNMLPMPVAKWEWYATEDEGEQLSDLSWLALPSLPQAVTRRARPRPWSEQAKSWFRRCLCTAKPGQESPRLLVAIPAGTAAPPLILCTSLILT